MSFNPQEKEVKSYETIPEGLYPARVARIIELGDQQDRYGVKTKVVIGFTIPSQTVNIDGVEKQKMIWTFPLNQTSNPDSTLMKYVKAIKADATHLNQLLKRPCMLEIIETEKDDKIYNNISNVTKPLAGIQIEEPDVDVYMYEFENGEDEIFEKLGEYRQNQIRNAINWGV